ncbi:MAG: hypothetical protein ACI4EX_06155 [Lachnospiraceae bacterium]
MICKSCGGEYADHLSNCPYCNTENAKVAKEKKHSILTSYDEEAEEIKRELPGRVIRRGTSLYIKLLFVVLLLILMVSGFVMVYSQFSANRSYDQRQKDQEILEQYFEDGEYGKLKDYLEQSGTGANYRKYKEVVSVWDREERLFKYLDWFEEYDGVSGEEERAAEYRAEALRCAIDLLDECEKNRNDNVILGNEEVLKKFEERTISKMDEYGFTKEELKP